jgi:hypothetical protein
MVAVGRENGGEKDGRNEILMDFWGRSGGPPVLGYRKDPILLSANR